MMHYGRGHFTPRYIPEPQSETTAIMLVAFIIVLCVIGDVVILSIWQAPGLKPGQNLIVAAIVFGSVFSFLSVFAGVHALRQAWFSHLRRRRLVL